MGMLDESGDDVLDGRNIHYKITRGLRGLELVHQVEIKDDATGIRAKSGKFLSVDTSWRKAKELYTSSLKAAGHLNTSPPPVEQPPSQTPIVAVSTPTLPPTEHVQLSSAPAPDGGGGTAIAYYVPLIASSFVVVFLTIGILWYFSRRKDTTTSGSSTRQDQRRHIAPWDQVIKIRDMMNMLGSDVYPKWELFATELGIEPGNIGCIREKERDGKLCVVRMLEEWRDNPPQEYPFKKESAVAILRKPAIGLNRLAEQIERGNH